LRLRDRKQYGRGLCQPPAQEARPRPDRHAARYRLPAWTRAMRAAWPMAGASMSRRLILALTLAMTSLWLLAVGLGLVVMEEEFAEIFDGTLQETAERLVPLVVDELDHRGAPGISPWQLQTRSSSGDREYLVYQVRDLSGQLLIRSHDAP